METREFGTRLRELRRQAGLSQRELAAKVEVDFTYLSKIENGILPPPSEKVILRLAEALNADKDELLILAGKIPADIAQLLKSREALQLLRASRTPKKVEASTKKRGAIFMNYKRFARVAVPITLVIAMAASLWFAAPLPVRAFNISAPVANSPISGNTTYLLGERVTIPANIRFLATELKDFSAISINITGIESFTKDLPIEVGNYQYTDVPGTLDVGVSWASGVGPSGYGSGYIGGDRFGYGYSTGSGNITYNIRWTPPYVRSVAPPSPPANLPGVTSVFNISIPDDVENTTWAAYYYPQGLAYDGTYLYVLVPASYYDGTNYMDVVLKFTTEGSYVGWFKAPGQSWQTEALTSIGSNLYAAYNTFDYTTWTSKGNVKKSPFSDNWTAIAGLSNLNAIGGLASDGTNLYIAYRDELTIEKRNPSTGAVISTFDLSTAWAGGMGFGPPIWGFDALAYSSDLYAAQGEMVIKVDASTGAKTGEYKTNKWSIRGLEFISDVAFSNGNFNILYLATNEWPNSKIYRAAKPGDTPLVENTPVGSYTTEFRVVADGTTYTDASSFTLSKLSVAPGVTISAPLPNFAVGAGAEDITITGSVNDPSITSVTVGITLPDFTAFQDNTENETQTLANWQHAAVSGTTMWIPYSADDYWHRSNIRDHTGGSSWSWRYANVSENNYVSSEGWKANAGALRSKNAVTLGEDNKLTFWTWYDGEFDFWPDRKIVEVSTDNITWTPVAWLAKFWPPFMPPDITPAQWNALKNVPEKVWTKVEVSLSAFAGDDIYLRFRFDTMDDWNNNYEGWYIDDISITGSGFVGQTAAVNSNLQFSSVFTLAEGVNTIAVSARRTNYEPKLTGQASVTGSLDTATPVLTLGPVTTPTNQLYQTISGNVVETNFDRLELKNNGVLKWSTTVLGTNGAFSQPILLSEGDNSIFVEAKDKVGLSANTTALIKLDTTGPVFESVFPGSDNKTYDVAYMTGESSARTDDWFFIAVKVSDAASDIASVRLVTPNQSESQGPSAMRKADLPEAVIDNWGISATTKAQMNYIMPMQLPTGLPAGDYSWTVVARDTAGNSSNTTVVTRIVTTLEAFNIYLLPDWNLVSTPLIPTTTNIATLTADIAATGLFERVWYYDASAAGTASEWKLYVPGVGGDLTTLEAGKGYWFKMKPLTSTTSTSAIDSFTEAGKVSGPMATGLPNTPAPVKLTISGSVLQAGAVVPPVYTVYAGWNLVGLHSEHQSPVSTALQSLTVPQQKWGSLLQYLNYISFPMREEGTPQIDLGRFDRLVSTENMEPGRGFWLYMVESGTIVP